MKCEICNDGKDFKNLNSHIRAKHGIQMDEYEKIVAEKSKEEEQVVEEEPTTSVLDVVMKEHDLTIDDVIDIIDKHFSKDEMTEEQREELRKLDTFEKKAEEIAKKMLDRSNIDTQDLYIAEVLTKKFGYKVIGVSSSPKTWHLRRR